MLRKIILENFMSHGRTEIELADGLTVLTGPNNCGKSAVVAALQILATNGRTTHVMRHGAKTCRITVETDDNHTVVWERKNSTVKYTLDGEDIHRVGASTPDRLHDLLRLDRVEADTGKTKQDYDIHFGEQKSPVFLLGETGSRAASFFASSSDASRLVEMQHRHRSNLREKRSEAKRLESERVGNEKRLKAFLPLDQIMVSVAKADAMQQQAVSDAGRIERLGILISALGLATKNSQRLHLDQQCLSRIDQTETTPGTLNRDSDRKAKLSDLISKLSSLAEQKRSLQRQDAAFKRLASSPNQHDVQSLRDRIVGLSTQSQHQRHCQRVLGVCETLEIPPVMQPANDCRSTIQTLTTVTNRLKQEKNTNQILTRIEVPPQTEDTKGLRAHVHRINEAMVMRASARNTVARMAALKEPPIIESSDRLNRLCCELILRESTAEQAEVAAKVLNRLRQMDEPVSVAPMQKAMEQMQTAISLVASTKKIAASAQRAVRQCESDIRAFVSAHPTCKTCGGSMDPETLMSAGPGIHQHAIRGGADE
jgi:hypothetical protein